MRTFSTYLTNETGYPVSKPQYLIELTFPGVLVYRWSTRKDVYWSNYQFSKQRGVAVSFSSNGPNMPNSCSLTIMNTNLEFSTALLSEGLEAELNVWLAYGEKNPLDASDTIPRFQGYVYSMSSGNHMSIVLDAQAKFHAINKQFPAVMIRPPYFNFLPAPGESFKWGTRTVTVSR